MRPWRARSIKTKTQGRSDTARVGKAEMLAQDDNVRGAMTLLERFILR